MVEKSICVAAARSANRSRRLRAQLLWAALQAISLIAVYEASAAGRLVGKAHILDGDTIVIGEVRVRLEGIDAPETDQVCLDANGEQWNCGVTARDQLVRQIDASSVSCTAHGQDRYGRVLADCVVNGRSLNAWMAREGLALSYTSYSHQYASDEASARRARRGLWAGAFIAPWDWRHRNKSTEILGALLVPVTA